MKTSFLLAVPFALLALTSVHVAQAAAPTVPECLSASEASIKLRSEHRLRLARAQLLTCASASCPGEVAEECSRRMDQITAAIPTVVFEVKDGTGHELSAVSVTMDGEVVADHLDGTALTLDPGSHAFAFEVAGQPAVTETIILHEGDKGRHESVTLGSPLAVGAAVTAPPAVPLGSASASPAILPAANPGNARRVLGIAVGSGGLAGLAVGGIFGGLTLSEKSALNSACPSHQGCLGPAISDHTNGLTYATVSTVGFIAGSTLLAGGLALYLTAPSGRVVTVDVQVMPGALGATATF
jgi:hypothetical protein